MFTLSHFNKTVIAEDEIEQVNGFESGFDSASQWSPLSDVTLTKKNQLYWSLRSFHQNLSF